MAQEKRRLSHPLCGADLKTLLKITSQAGGVGARGLPQLSIAYLAAICRLPFSLVERAMVESRRDLHSPIAPPIFILGHWRSGTTHLYNILSKSNQFGYVSPFATALPWDFLTIGRMFLPYW